jgi:cytochrome P450
MIFDSCLLECLGVAARHGKARQFAADQVKRRKGKAREPDLLADLCRVHEQKAEEMNDMAVISLATSNIFAGSDTAVISLRSIICHLLKNPDTRRNLIGEIDDRVRGGLFSDPVGMEEANDMPYLQACMYEALRLHPANNTSLPRVVHEGGTEIDGHCFYQADSRQSF